MGYIVARGMHGLFKGLDVGLRRIKYVKDGYVASGYVVEVAY